MPHVRERQPEPDEPGVPLPTGDASGDAASEDPAAGLAGLEGGTPRTPGRVDAGEAVTGTRAGSSGEAPPGGVPGDDGALTGDPV
ncbi:MAG TPA: hypothetical protein VFY23_09220 [Candidatus Limnocylindrales bacterium]|nr:hypothetical protein [Candidatus Limnocylindrales bacterium]